MYKINDFKITNTQEFLSYSMSDVLIQQDIRAIMKAIKMVDVVKSRRRCRTLVGSFSNGFYPDIDNRRIVKEIVGVITLILEGLQNMETGEQGRGMETFLPLKATSLADRYMEFWKSC